MRHRVLLVAGELDLRAKFARELHSSGYAVELACDMKRALRLAADYHFRVAIVASEPSPASLAMILTLRDTVPRIIVVTEGLDEIARLHHSLPGVAEFILKSADEGLLATRVSEMIALADSAAGEHVSVPSIVYIGDCKLDLGGYVFVTANAQEVALTRAEADLLKELVRNPCQVVSRDKLRYAVAGRGADPFDRSMDMLVTRVRRKIEPDPKVPRFLLSIPGVGYKLIARTQPAEARQLRAEPSEPERRQITVLCCKLVGAIGLAVEVDPEDLSQVTKKFQDAAVAAITGMGGTIATVTPDEIQAFFGYPEAHEDDAERAVTAGLDAVAKIGQLVSPKGEPLQARVAVATGLALASHRQAVGEPLVIAAAMCDEAAPNSVLVTTSTSRFLSRAFVREAPEPYPIAGVSDAIRACRVTAKRGVASRFKANHPSKVTGLIARDQELKRLLALWDRIKRGEGQVALVSGEAGIGKSHLCEFLLGHLVEEPHATLRYQCSPHHLNSPFYPVVSQLEHAMGLKQTDTQALKFEKLKASLSRAVTPTREDILLYAALLSISAPEREAALGLTPQRQKDLTIAALSRHLLRFADKQPLIIALADAHWIDSSTLELVNKIIRLIKSAQVLLLLTFRPEFVPQWLSEPHVTSLILDRMDREQCHDMITNLIGDKALPVEVEEQIIDKADGIPLFVEELTKSVLESELVQDVGDQDITIGPLPPLAVPATLRDSVTARLDRLGPAKEIAQIGAVVGREFSHLLLAAVAPESANSLQASLAQLVASGVVFMSGEAPDATSTFKHALVRDAAYAMLSRGKRQRLHKRVADALENGFALTVETQPELLAHHLAEAGFAERGIDYLRRAGQRSIERSANAEAIGHLTRALELLQSLPDYPQRKSVAFPLEALLSQAMIASYGYTAPSTRQTLLRAKALIDDTADPLQKFAVLYGLWASHYTAGKPAKLWDTAVEFLAEAERTNDTTALCVAHRLVGTTHVALGEFAAALDHLKLARMLYDSKRDAGNHQLDQGIEVSERHAGYHQFGQDIGVSILCYLSWTLWHLGRVDQATEAATEAMKLAEKLSHPHTLVYTICHARGFMDLFRRRCEDTSSYAGLVISTCNENGFSHWLNCGVILDGWGAVCAGHLDRGMAVLQEGIVRWQEEGAQIWMPMFRILEAETYLKAGRDEAALRAIEQALAEAESIGERWATAEALRIKARILSSAGNGKNFLEIEAILLNSLEIARRQQARCWQLRTSCDLARLWQRQGRNKKALKLLQSAYDRFTEGFDTADLRDAHALLRKLRRNLTDGGRRRRVRPAKNDKKTAVRTKARARPSHRSG
jgi:DNA-binding response OmpR family regulator/class 3 adenylate cyclase/predicted ATPase